MKAILQALEPVKHLAELPLAESEDNREYRYFVRVSDIVGAECDPYFYQDFQETTTIVSGPKQIRLPLMPGETPQSEVAGESQVRVGDVEITFDFKARLIGVENGGAIYAVTVDEDRQWSWRRVRN